MSVLASYQLRRRLDRDRRASRTSPNQVAVLITPSVDQSGNRERSSGVAKACSVWLTVLRLAAILMASWLSLYAVAGEPVATVGVKVLPSPPPEPAMAMGMVPREEPEPPTPGARLPQYQLHHLDRGEFKADPTEPGLRFLLALPQRLLVVEANITVNGQPYANMRERRVDEILQFAADPEKFKTGMMRWEDAKATAADLLTQLSQTVNRVVNSDDDIANPSSDSSVVEPEATPEVPATAEYVNPKSIYERIERYMAATGEVPSRAEMHWLLTNWVDGPTVLYLKDNFQRFRADQRPVFQVLDRDRDGQVSQKELGMAVMSFQECDLDRNDVIGATELAEVVNDPRLKSQHAGQTLLICRVPTKSDAALTYRRLAACFSVDGQPNARLPRFDDDQDGRLSETELAKLHNVAPDIQLSVAFDTRSVANATLSIDHFAADILDLNPQVQQGPNYLTVDLEGQRIDFAAVQQADSDQISIGAVEDGYPLLPALDPNDDGRFTIRELRELPRLLANFDTNRDGSLTADEAHSPIRICFGLGPNVHRELALLRSVNVDEGGIKVAGPDWFQQMDRNNDNDISRKEFPGTDEQFNQHDTDADELISAQEALHASDN